MTLEEENQNLKNELAAVKRAYDLLEREAKRLNDENRNLLLKLNDITMQRYKENFNN